jgi:D-alanyl-D-alanine carboxypeptidase/D-alanyl-D-alanine-endopeptidase (penicillin-binding protein 4)
VSEPESTTRPARKGLSALIRKHPTAWLTAALAVVFLMLGTGAVFAGAAVGGNTPAAEADVNPDAAESVAPTAPAEADAGRPVPAALPGATRLRTCSVAGPASDPRLMGFKGYVMNAKTGEVLFSREGDVPNRTASVMKVLTASAALAALGPDYRLTTKVVAGATPNSIVLVGGGDATLSASGSSVYAGAPKIADLAAKAKAAHDAAYPGTPTPRSCSTPATGTPQTSGTRSGSAPNRPSATTPRSPP